MPKMQSAARSAAQSGGNCYSEMPTIKDLADEITKSKGQGIRLTPTQKYLLSVAVTAFALLLIVRVVNPNLKHSWLSYLVLFDFFLIVAAWIALLVSNLMGEIKRSHNSLARQLDEHMQNEELVIRKLLLIPTKQLVERRNRLEAQLQVLDRRVAALKLIAFLGPPILVVAHPIITGITTGSKTEWALQGEVLVQEDSGNRIWRVSAPGITAGKLEKPSELEIEVLTFVAFVTAVAVSAAAGVQFGMQTLHRVSHTLKAASEQDRSYSIGEG